MTGCLQSIRYHQKMKNDVLALKQQDVLLLQAILIKELNWFCLLKYSAQYGSKAKVDLVSAQQKGQLSYLSKSIRNLFKLKSSPYNNILSLMSHRSNGCRKSSETSQILSIDSESSSSNFSLQKTRKIQRKSNKKKITKIVHTFGFMQTDKDGLKRPIYYQQTGETAFRDPNSIKNLVFRQINDVAPHMIQNAKKSTGITEKEPNETMVKTQTVHVFPSYQTFQPAQFYYIF